MTDLPNSARIVIIGGGVGGTSIAYHLGIMGCSDVVLVDRDELTNGSTFHSAGLVGQLRSSVNLTKTMMYSAELYRELSRDLETDPGWVECGGIRLACTPERLSELHRQVGWAKTFGLPLEEITPKEAQDLFPLMSCDGVLGATFLETDGYLDPSLLTHSFAKQARSFGIEIATHTRVVGIETENNRVRGVQTDRGRIECEIVVNAAGMYAAEIGRMAGVRIPIIPFSHQYLITTAFREESDTKVLPTLRDPDLLVYFRQDVRGLLMGGYERNSRAAFLTEQYQDSIPGDFNGRLLDEDWARFEEITENSTRRVPIMAEMQIRKLLNGPEGFTPDNEFCLGETEIDGLFVAAGFCAHGIAGAGGIGKVMAEWILRGEPSMDLWEMDIRRFGKQYRSGSYTLARTRENYETYYDIRFPNQEREAGRPLRRSPAYQWHLDHGASFGEKSGWERVNYYRSNEDPTLEHLRPNGWAGKYWSTAIAIEHRATRNTAGLFDETSFAKFEVSGLGAARLLNMLCDNDVTRGVGRVTYTQMLNERGGIEADFTVTQLAADRFLIVTGTAFGGHDMSWIRHNLPSDGSVMLRDMTGAYACFGVWGPNAPSIIASLTAAPIDSRSFPYMTAQEIAIADVPVLALRVTFVGEVGWEFYCSSEYGMTLWEALIEAGEPFGMVTGGYRAIDSLRLEKGYRIWGGDITPDETPYEAGLEFCVKLDKKEFIGRDAIVGVKKAGFASRLVTIVFDDLKDVALGNEPVRIDGIVHGRVTSGGIGYSIDRSIAYAYIPQSLVSVGRRCEVYLFGKWAGATVSEDVLFDSESERIKGRY